MKQETIIKDFYLPVKIVETSDILGKKNSLLMPYNKKAVVVTLEDGTEKIVSFCSDMYGLVKNEEIFPEIENLLSNEFEFKKTYKHWNHAKFYVDYEIMQKDVFIGDKSFNDQVRPVIRVMHSYNGQMRYHALMGIGRKICSNGLWGYTFKNDFFLKHTKENLKHIINNTIEGINDFVGNIGDFKENYNLLASKKVNNIEERVEQIIDLVDIFPKKQKSQVIERAYIEMNENNLEKTDWLIYNAFNYQLNHNTEIKTQEYQKMVIDKKVFDVIFEDKVK